MVKAFYLSENSPFPNNPLPVLYYENVLDDELSDSFNANDVIAFFENNGYENAWVGGILDRHHFHSNAHEALACTKGKVTIQLGGPNADMYTLRKGDVILLPAGTAHKKLKGSEGFEIVGAYPEGSEDYDMQYGEGNHYDELKEKIANVDIPLTDPVTNSPRHIKDFWQTDN